LQSVRESLASLYRYDQISADPVARGGCGHIWRAHDRLFDRTVAIKTIDELLAWNNESARRSFIKEAELGARLGQRSRHIVQVIDFGFAGNVPFFVMEWIEPRSGRSAIDISPDMGAVTIAEAKNIMFEVCEAVGLAHDEGIAHSDIAPWNIIYDPQARVYKLADFGLVKIIEPKLVSAGSGSLLTGGRADFMPITVLTRRESIGFGSDVYALAVTFRALLEGGDCLNGHVVPTPSVIRVRHMGCSDAPPQVRQLLRRFIDEHTEEDKVANFLTMLQRIPKQ